MRLGVGGPDYRETVMQVPLGDIITIVVAVISGGLATWGVQLKARAERQSAEIGERAAFRESLMRTVTDMQTTVTSLRGEVSKLYDENLQLRKKVAGLEASEARQKSEIEALRKELDTQENMVKRLRAALAKYKKDTEGSHHARQNNTVS